MKSIMQRDLNKLRFWENRSHIYFDELLSLLLLYLEKKSWEEIQKMLFD